MTDRNDHYVFASVPYVNAAPLAHFLPRVRAGVRVIYDRPAAMAGYLAARRADAAMVPVVDYLALDGLGMIDGLGICADGDVQSVLLKCYRPIEQVRRVQPDPASRTSNALARVLLEDHFHLSVRVAPVGDGVSADAAVIIGDAALAAEPAPCGDYDLGGLWKAMTGLPFVFAVWAHRADHADPADLAAVAHAAKAAGLAAVDDLAAVQARRTGLSEPRLREYLASVIHYDLGDRERQAMRLFRERLAERNLLAPGREPCPSVGAKEGPGR